MRRFFHRSLWLALAALVQACCPQTCQQPMTIVAPAVAAPAAVPAPRVASGVQAGDILVVSIKDEKDLSGEYLVAAGGTVNMPLVGAIAVAGKSKEALGPVIAEAYRGEYLKHPEVSVNVKERAQ